MSGKLRIGTILVFSFVVWAALPTSAQDQNQINVQENVQVNNEVQHDSSPPLNNIESGRETGPERERGLGRIEQVESPNTRTDPVLQSSPGPVVATTGGISFDGIGVGLGSFTPRFAPPDTNGAAGDTHMWNG